MCIRDRDVNANYEKLKTEVSTWTGFTDNAQYETSINDKLLPIIDESLDKLSKIELKSDEVKALKEKYKKVLDTYKEGFTSFLTAVQNNDEEGAQTAQTKISEGASLIAEYNTALETLAKEKDMEVKY